MDKPSPTSVYRYYDLHGVLLYVGITSRGPQRQFEHNSSKEWWPYVERQDVQHFPTRVEAEMRERELIRNHQPPFNTQHNSAAEDARAAYLAYRRALPTGAPVDLVRAVCQCVPLRRIESETGDVLLSTTLPFAAVAQQMERVGDVNVKSGRETVGQMLALIHRGPFAILTSVIRRGAELGDAPFARVKIIYGKGDPTFRVHNVQLGEPAPARSLP